MTATTAEFASTSLVLSSREVAQSWGVSQAAVDLIHASDVIDLHLDTFISWRLARYDILRKHSSGPLGRHFFGQADLPRLTEGGYTGALWSITTNPFRTAASRWKTFQRNVKNFTGLIDQSAGRMTFVRTVAEYRAARARGAHAVFLSIQGGHALDAAPNGAASVPDRLLTRVTLVHLISTSLGTSSTPFSPFGQPGGHLTEKGRATVRDLNANRVFVDLAHIHPVSFHDAVAVHDKSQPLIVTHTGVTGVRPHWRNLDDKQLKAVADTGGTIGVIFQPSFLARPGGPTDGRMIVEHVQHIIKVVGEDFVSIGSDYDGFISPPPELASIASLPRLVQHMLDAGLRETTVSKFLGANFLRAFALLRPV
jgi:membrane dipeptidase